MDLQSVRNDYTKSTFREEDLTKDPIIIIQNWVKEALQQNIIEATAMSLSTVGEDGFPKSRIVLAKSIREEGISFFTNYDSQKGKDIKSNKKVSLLFFWPDLQRQIRITGLAEKLDPKTSDEYFSSRPFESQIGAIVSQQSKKLKSRDELVAKFNTLKDELNTQSIKRPDNWGGYIVKPVTIEFWQGRENRLHDRFLYELNKDVWSIKRLAP